MPIFAKRGYLYIDFRCYTPAGKKIRCQEATKLPDNKKNRKIIEQKDKAIKYTLKTGTFDYLRFFPHGSKAHLFKESPDDLLFSDWWDQWLAEKSLRENTERSWNSTYSNHLKPYFGHYFLSQITEHEILVFRKVLEKKNLKASTINDKIIKVLCMALLKAHKRGILKEYPCEEISRLAEVRPDIDPFSFDELRAFLDFLSDKKPMWHDLILIWSRTGLRPGEMYALRWENIDYFNNKLLVRATRLPSGSEGPPKTAHSIRDVDIRPVVVEALKGQEARTRLMDSHIFMTGANKPFSDAFMRKKFRHLLALAKLKYRPPKQLRHTFATLHLAAGENPKWVSRQLGHSSTEITHRKYERFIPNLTRDDGSAFEKIMETKSKNGDHLVTRLGK